MLDPNKMSAKEAQALGVWPPQHVATGLMPYLKRIKHEIDVLDIGVGKGEGIYYLSKNVPNIRKFYGLSYNADYENILRVNMLDVKNVEQDYNGEEVDVVLVSMLPDTKAETLAKYYAKVKSGGIFAGDSHSLANTKVELSAFRRAAKIGTPIQIVDKEYWFWYKR